ncbi:hypothetical protein ruthe_02065 [Rubellimicrobium thermophilum DSM 16684]|uniref:Uncharacterized protein n=1 Tax=Rubellimicrobium thermophilum DSM 16684 TaxID=1123069 RepID=S9S3D5_9RHOB|nr:hypothetical protein [Rubellimicrobium thermophilum]EPX84705.1 hypothetical protein ruthe_02065 [Rubellimicrobium thermophilum DSM 16684]
MDRLDPARAYAACVLGGTDPAAVAAPLEDLGLTRTETEDGMIVLSADGLPYAITVDPGEGHCDVTSESFGTDVAMGKLMIVGGMAGFQADDSAPCIALLIAGIRAEVTSSGNDPICYDEATSNVRFTLADGT